MNIRKVLFIILMALISLNACQEPTKPTETKATETKQSKLEIKHAQLFEIEYYSDYKKISLKNPWQTAIYWEYFIYKDNIKTYHKGRQTHMSAASSAAVLSSTLIGIFSELGLEDSVKFIDQIQYINNPKIRHNYQQKTISELGEGDLLNVEKIILNQPLCVFTSGWEQINPNYDKVIKQNIPVAFCLEWQEKTPLARAEWIKFVAAFYNLEEQAKTLFDAIEEQYLSLQKLTSNIHSEKSILHGAPWSGTWYIAGGQSFMAQFYKDINANYLWSDDSSTASLPLSFEAVYLKAKDADIWFASTPSKSLKAFMNGDDRFLEFKAFNKGTVYSNAVLKEGEQANAFWETGIVNPHWVLEDLISVVYPDLLPNHKLRFYVQLK